MAKKKKAKKVSAPKDFIAVTGNSGCYHEEFATPELAAQQALDNGDANISDTISVYKKVGEFKIATSLTPVK